MTNNSYILKHYQKLAKTFGISPFMSMRDQYIRSSEEKFFLHCLKHLTGGNYQKEFKLLDLGCGNGHTLEIISKAYPNAILHGIEFSPDLVEIAKSRNIANLKVVLGDMRKELNENEFDIVLTQRSLINLQSKEQQRTALAHIVNSLKPQRYLLMSESFDVSLREVNSARKEFNLSPIDSSKHNHYLSKSLFHSLKHMGMIKEDLYFPENYLSTYFFITRVLHPSLRKEGDRMNDSMLADFFKLALPTGIGSFGPIEFHVFKKIIDNAKQ